MLRYFYWYELLLVRISEKIWIIDCSNGQSKFELSRPVQIKDRRGSNSCVMEYNKLLRKNFSNVTNWTNSIHQDFCILLVNQEFESLHLRMAVLFLEGFSFLCLFIYPIMVLFTVLVELLNLVGYIRCTWHMIEMISSSIEKKEKKEDFF